MRIAAFCSWLYNGYKRRLTIMLLCKCLTKSESSILMRECDPDYYVICGPDVNSVECAPEVNMCAPDYGEDGCLPDCGPNE